MLSFLGYNSKNVIYVPDTWLLEIEIDNPKDKLSDITKISADNMSTYGETDYISSEKHNSDPTKKVYYFLKNCLIVNNIFQTSNKKFSKIIFTPDLRETPKIGVSDSDYNETPKKLKYIEL